MTFKLNLNEVEDAPDYSEPIPAGTYIANITGGEVGEAGPNAKYPGSTVINWEFTISSGAHEGRKQWRRTSLYNDSKALMGFKQLVTAVGMGGELEFETPEAFVQEVIGKPVKIVVKQREWQGEMRNDVSMVKPIDSADLADASVLP